MLGVRVVNLIAEAPHRGKAKGRCGVGIKQCQLGLERVATEDRIVGGHYGAERRREISSVPSMIDLA